MSLKECKKYDDVVICVREIEAKNADTYGKSAVDLLTRRGERVIKERSLDLIGKCTGSSKIDLRRKWEGISGKREEAVTHVSITANGPLGIIRKRGATAKCDEP